jgi:hypothetical protein
MRRLWARIVAKLEDTHRRRTVMANAKANAAETKVWADEAWAAEMKAWADISIEVAADIWPVD